MGEELTWDSDEDITWDDPRDLTWDGEMPALAVIPARRRKVSLTTTEILGFSASVSKFLSDNKAALLAKKLDVTDWITELDGQTNTANQSNIDQEKMKADLQTLTAQTEAALSTAYDSASTKLDAAVGTLGKTTDQGRQGAKLRSNIRRGPNKKKGTPPNP